MSDDPREAAKKCTGAVALTEIERGMRVGLGTGSTVKHFIVALAEARLDTLCVATSVASARLAEELGLRVTSLDAAGPLDVTVDGADEIDPDWNLIKGGGGAHVREKIVAAASRRFVVVADRSKLVERLGRFALPVEVLPFAPVTVERQLAGLGAAHVVRRQRLSDNGHPILDASFGEIAHPAELADRIAAIPGVVDHGIFPASMVSRVIVGTDDGAEDAPAPAERA